jgi:hypothetical protein
MITYIRYQLSASDTYYSYSRSIYRQQVMKLAIRQESRSHKFQDEPSPSENWTSFNFVLLIQLNQKLT